MAHITGGGLTDNIPRVLPAGTAVELNTNSWQMPPLFKLIQKEGNIPDSEMRRVFNVGLGMIVIASPDHVEMVMNSSTSFMKVGTVIEQTGDDRVVFQS